MKLVSNFAAAAVAFAFASMSEAASVNGSINFSSGQSGSVVLQDSNGNPTSNPTLATGFQSWTLPETNGGSGSFLNVPKGQSISFTQPWVFDPATPIAQLWTIPGGDNFSFNLSPSSVISITQRDADFLIISVTGTLASPNYDNTPATWFFSTQSGSTDGKFSWSSVTTAVPETGTSMIFGTALLAACCFRRRIPAISGLFVLPPKHENTPPPRDGIHCPARIQPGG